jgi:hypothetical protein
VIDRARLRELLDKLDRQTRGQGRMEEREIDELITELERTSREGDPVSRKNARELLLYVRPLFMPLQVGR